MTGKTALGSICAGIALLIAVRSPNQTAQTTASVVGSGLLGYTVTSFMLDCKRRQKSRTADAEAYLEFLRQINQERASRLPPMPSVCRGCIHYHGQSYGGHQLICGMHPYGVDTDHCADWEAES